MSTKRKNYSQEYKLEAVRLSHDPGTNVSSPARKLNIKTKLLYRWRGP